MKKFNSSARYGSFSLIVTAVVLAILILVNLAVNSLPATMTSITGEKADVYKVSDTSKKYLKTLDEEITIYVVQIESANSEHDLMIKKYVERYAALSNKLTVKYVDPEIKPMFLPSYNKDKKVDEELLVNTVTHLVVESGRRARIIPYSDIFTIPLSESDLNVFYQKYHYIPYSYDIENCLLSAIDYVTLEVVPKLYYTSSHGETSLDELFEEYSKLENIDLSEINIESKGEIPSDAQAVVIYAPQGDFSKKEIAALKKYADNGGNIILSTMFNPGIADRNHENLYGFAKEYYGMSYNDALVHEGQRGRFLGSATWIFVTMTSKVPSALYSATNGSVLFTYAHSINIENTLPEGVTVDTLFTTTENGYTKPTLETDEGKKDSDPGGTFVLGAISKRTNNNVTSELWWFSSIDALRMTANFNLEDDSHLLAYTLIGAVGKSNMVSAVAMTVMRDTVDISDKAATLWSWIIIAIVPCSILGYGIYVRVRRVRR